MNELRIRKNIEQALKDFQRGALAMNAKNLLNTLGYESEITMDFESSLAEEFISYFDEFGKLNPERAMVDNWESIDFLFQLTEQEISGSGQMRIAFIVEPVIICTRFEETGNELPYYKRCFGKEQVYK
ncbi:MAG: hypothetical protein OXU51_25660 [Candidatus Poribacteria bacterium]|nr:hypothetical protein [Candidatus Poribacteria bacterium]